MIYSFVSLKDIFTTIFSWIECSEMLEYVLFILLLSNNVIMRNFNFVCHLQSISFFEIDVLFFDIHSRGKLQFNRINFLY